MCFKYYIMHNNPTRSYEIQFHFVTIYSAFFLWILNSKNFSNVDPLNLKQKGTIYVYADRYHAGGPKYHLSSPAPCFIHGQQRKISPQTPQRFINWRGLILSTFVFRVVKSLSLCQIWSTDLAKVSPNYSSFS